MKYGSTKGGGAGSDSIYPTNPPRTVDSNRERTVALRDQGEDMARTKKSAGVTRKSIVRKERVAGKTRGKAKPAKLVKAKTAAQTRAKSAGPNRAEGIRQFALAGRPTKEQFILVYVERGPKMTWDERAKAGVPAKQFQSALAAKKAGR
jgi:hypothetical protein